jgi:hypothetical protein
MEAVRAHWFGSLVLLAVACAALTAIGDSPRRQVNDDFIIDPTGLRPALPAKPAWTHPLWPQ